MLQEDGWVSPSRWALQASFEGAMLRIIRLSPVSMELIGCFSAEACLQEHSCSKFLILNMASVHSAFFSLTFKFLHDKLRQMSILN